MKKISVGAEKIVRFFSSDTFCAYFSKVSIVTPLADAAWSNFYNKLAYKCRKAGKLFVQIESFYPSSKTCPRCLHKFEDLILTMRQWSCPHCGQYN